MKRIYQKPAIVEIIEETEADVLLSYSSGTPADNSLESLSREGDVDDDEY